MRELGWIYGRHYVVERREQGDQLERIRDEATAWIRSGVDMFLCTGGIVATPLQPVTRTIPIVTTDAGDLVEAGLAASLARPGGNVTGVQTWQPEVAAKEIALLKEAIPGLSRAGVLTGAYDKHRPLEESAKALHIGLQTVSVHRFEELDAVFSQFRVGRAQAILVQRTPFMGTYRGAIAALALRHGIPTISDVPGFAADGGLLSYGYDLREVFRLLAETVNQILRGTPAGEVPIRQVTTFQLVINLKTAKALNLTVPPSLLQRADQVIE